MKRTIAVVVALLALTALRPAAAQEPTPSPTASNVQITLAEVEPGVVRLRVTGAGTAIGATDIMAFVSEIGSDQGAIVPLRTDGVVADDISMHFDRPLDGMPGDGCYRVDFFVRPHEGPGKPDSPFEGAGYPRLETRACVDGGVMTFPAYDGVASPPPAPPTDVRLVRVPASDYPGAGGDTWTIEWTDNSDDEVSFAASIVLYDRSPATGGRSIERMDLPEVQRDSTMIGSIGFLFAPNGPTPEVCGYALISVEVFGGDGTTRSHPPVEVPACFGYGTISLSRRGSGRRGGRPRRPSRIVLLARRRPALPRASRCGGIDASVRDEGARDAPLRWFASGLAGVLRFLLWPLRSTHGRIAPCSRSAR